MDECHLSDIMFAEIELQEILKNLIELPAETEVVEFKRAENSFSDNDLGEYFSALSNEANLKDVQMSWLVFGIDNKNHKIVGTNYKPSRPSLDEMKKKIADHTTNRITFDEIYELTYEGKRVVMFQIPAAPQGLPIAYKGHYYGRDNESLVALNLHEIEYIRSQIKANSDWSAEIVAGATIEDIDPEAVRYFVNVGIDSARLSVATKHQSVEQVLDSLNMVANNGQLKRAAILLFGKNPLRFFTGVRFRIGRFGQGETDLMSQDVVEGNCIQMADRVLEILKNKYLVSTIKYEGLRRKEELEIPVMALREVLYNAIVHKSYLGTDIQMQVYADRVVVWNEGQLPEGYTLETLMQPHKSRAKNQLIADAFFRAGFIEAWGRGIGKVCEEMQAYGLKAPLWRNICGGIEVTIERKVSGTPSEKTGTILPETGTTLPEIGTTLPETGTILPEIGTILPEIGTTSSEIGTTDWRNRISAKTDLQERQIALLLRLMEIICEDNSVSYSHLAKMTGKTRSTIQQYMLYLNENGYIRRIGDKYSGHWEII